MLTKNQNKLYIIDRGINMDQYILS